MKQALEAYHQDMLESGKYSSLNAVQLWDDLHSTLTSLTNKFINSKLSSTRNNLPSVNQKLKSPNFLNNPTLRIFLMWPQNWVKWSSLQTLYKQFQTRFCLCCTFTQTQFCPPGRPHESHWCRQIHARHYSHIQKYHPKKPFDPTITNPKTFLPKVAQLGNLTTNLEGC